MTSFHKHHRLCGIPQSVQSSIAPEIRVIQKNELPVNGLASTAERHDSGESARDSGKALGGSGTALQRQWS
jgi:hypothetical protein